MGEQLVVENGLVTIERCQLDDVDQFAGLDDAPHIGRVERMACDLDIGCAKARWQLFRLVFVVLVNTRGDSPLTHNMTVPMKSEAVNR